MKASLAEQHLLLRLQASDLELLQLRRRRATSASEARVKDLEQQVETIRRATIDTTTKVQDLGRDIARAEDELAKVRARVDRDHELANSGADARLQRELQHELTSLARRLTELEDTELEYLQEQEDLQHDATKLEQDTVRLAAGLTAARAARDLEIGELVAAIDTTNGRRTETARSLPAPLLARYEQIRAGGGAGAALLKGSQCQACRMELPASEVARLHAAPAEELQYCEECGAILVRTEPGDQ